MLGVSHGALQFMTYEEMKTFYNEYRKLPIDTKLVSLVFLNIGYSHYIKIDYIYLCIYFQQGTKEYITFAAVSKFIAALATYPYQVIRARLQDHHLHYHGTMDCLTKTWRYEGCRGFYKGLSPYLLHVLPNICLVLVIYEKFTGG